MTAEQQDWIHRIRCAAIRLRKSGVVVAMDRPARHHDIIGALYEWAGKPLRASDMQQGFLSAKGEFLTRREAAKLIGHERGPLYSEDVW